MLASKLIFEKSVPGKKAYSLPACDVPTDRLSSFVPDRFLRKSKLCLPEMSEPDVVRHYTGLAHRNHCVDAGFYPLGSCTMKYNPKISEDIAVLDGFQNVHPYQDQTDVQGCLELMHRLEQHLCEITGMDRISLQPAAGAHGEMAGLMMIRAYHEQHGENHRKILLVADSAHGTNPASASMAGFEVREVRSDRRGCVDLEALKSLLGPDVAGMMLTNPNTLGLFEESIEEIAKSVHDCGGMLYFDGANANAILGITRPGDMGFDVVHLNLHKTFGTPHGGGGPGAGPIGVKKHLEPYLPVPVVNKNSDGFYLDEDRPLSIGRIKNFYGSFSVIARAYAYIASMGAQGLKSASVTAVLNANYMMHRIKKDFDLPYDRICMHEFVLSMQALKEKTGVTAMDVAKALIDRGFHPPTVYFPTIVPESMMIEPTETESKETLDQFVEAMKALLQLAFEKPETLKSAPRSTFPGRLDDVLAARHPVLKYAFSERKGDDVHE